MAPDPGHDGVHPAIAQAAAMDIPGDLRGISIDQRRFVASEQLLVAYQIAGAILEATREELPGLAKEHGKTLLTGAEMLRRSISERATPSSPHHSEDQARLRCAGGMEYVGSLLVKLGDASDTELLLALNLSVVDLRALGDNALDYARRAGMLG